MAPPRTRDRSHQVDVHIRLDFAWSQLLDDLLARARRANPGFQVTIADVVRQALYAASLRPPTRFPFGHALPPPDVCEHGALLTEAPCRRCPPRKP